MNWEVLVPIAVCLAGFTFYAGRLVSRLEDEMEGLRERINAIDHLDDEDLE